MVFKRSERKADLDFAAGLILMMVLIAAVAFSCTTIFKESLRGKPGVRLDAFANAVKALHNKPAGSTDVFLGYVGSRHAILGFSSTSTRVQKSAVVHEGTDIREFFTAFVAERPTVCPYGKPCVCVVENPKVELAESVEYVASLTWEQEKCTPLENADGKNDFFNVHILPKEKSYFSEQHPDYFKGGFLIARGENIGGSFELARGVGDFELSNEPEISIEKTRNGIAVCVQQPCVREGMEAQQKLVLQARATFKEAQQAFEQENYPVAETLFNELVLLESQQKGSGFPGSIVQWEDEYGRHKEGVEFLLDAREHDTTYLRWAESLVKQRKYEEALPALFLAQHYATQEATKDAVLKKREAIDCSLRSFATCAKEPRDACYRTTEEKACVQCSRETRCSDFDHADACVTYACGLECAWNNEQKACREVSIPKAAQGAP